MDKEQRKNLIEIYKNCSDDDLNEMIQDGRDNFEEGAYELILAEAGERGIINNEEDKSGESPAGFESDAEMDFRSMNTEDLMGVLVNIHALDELNFHLASAEAIRRNIDVTDIRAYKKIVQCEQCSAVTQIDMIENPRPLIILKTIDETGIYTDALDEEGIPFELQIIVDDRDYKKAQMATNNILISQE